MEERWQTSLHELTDIKYALDKAAIVAITDPSGKITYVNEKFCEISQYRPEELVGRDHRIINSGHHPKAFFRELWSTIAGGDIWRGEIRNRAKDGSLYWVDTTIVPFVDRDGLTYQYMAIRYDITDRKRAEAKLQEQATLTRLGEMAAVVAHEVKNPLAGISGVLQVIASRMPEDGSDRAIIGDIQDRIDSLNAMVQDLLLFSRPTAPTLLPTAIGPLLANTAALLERDPELADIEVQIGGDNPTLLVDGEQLKIVFVNLLINAAQAMGGAGRVEATVTTTGPWCEVLIADRGPRLTPQVIEKMFDPFYTTKHRGSGLGLPTAKRIVEAHGGELTAESRAEGGTVMRVSLPAATP